MIKFNFQEQLDNNNIVEEKHPFISGVGQIKIKFKDTNYIISCIRGVTSLHAGFLHDSEGWEVWDLEMCDPISMSTDDINEFVNEQMKERRLTLK